MTVGAGTIFCLHRGWLPASINYPKYNFFIFIMFIFLIIFIIFIIILGACIGNRGLMHPI